MTLIAHGTVAALYGPTFANVGRRPACTHKPPIASVKRRYSDFVMDGSSTDFGVLDPTIMQWKKEWMDAMVSRWLA